MTKVLGIDASLNHTGIVELTDGVLSNYWYITDNKPVAKKMGEHAILFSVNDKDVDWQKGSILRLIELEKTFKTFLDSHSVDFIGMEDYALGNPRRAHYIGELGGILRVLLYKNGIPFRLQDPLTIKMFIADSGNADKDAVKDAVKNNFKVEFKFPELTDKQNKSVSEDLADAFAVAQLTWTEVQLRRGTLALSSLSEKQIRAFNRVTKLYPVNLLARDWL